MDTGERLARLVLHNMTAATYAARKLRQGMALDLKLEPAATGSLQLIAFHEGRLLGKVEPIPREYIEWIKTCIDNRCTVESLPVAQEDHLLKLILVRLERGQSLQAQTPQQPPAEPEPAPPDEPAPEALPAVIPQPELPVLMAEPRYLPASYIDRQAFPSALRRHGLKFVLGMAFAAFTAAAASGVLYLNSPCGKLWSYARGTSHCRLDAEWNLHFETDQPNAKALCASEVARMLPDVKLMRITLVSSASPVLVTCRLSK